MRLRKWLYKRDQVVFVQVSPHSDDSGLQTSPWYCRWHSSRWHFRRRSLGKLQATSWMRHDTRKFPAGYSCFMSEGSVRPPLFCLTRFNHCLLFKSWTSLRIAEAAGGWVFLSIYHLLIVCQSKWDNFYLYINGTTALWIQSLTHRWR